MTTEEKAKAYDELKVKAQELEEDGCFDKLTLFDLFPELEESEDEKIKDRLTNYFYGFLDGHEDTYKVGGHVKWEGLDVKDVIAWLEKQGKTSPTLSNSSNIGKVEQKHWSEEDESLCRQIEGILSVCRTKSLLSFDLYKKMLDLLKSLKDRVQPQTRQEWSEEDEENLKWFEKFFRAESVFAEGKNIPQDRYLWFKNLKGRVQSKQEWSEEDKKISTAIYESIDISILNDFGVSAHEAAIWLKSLRSQNKTYYWTENEIKFAISDYIRGAESYEKMVEKLRCLKPQSQWKPSEEMLEALYRVTPENVMEKSEDEILLDKLYQGLKYGRVLSKN